MEEVSHIIDVLKATEENLKNKEAVKLRELSEQTVHSASIYQDPGNITLAVLIYTLSKLVERRDYRKIKLWDKFVRRINSLFDLAILSLKEEEYNRYEDYLEKSRQALELISVNLRPYIQEVLRKASINKASRLYEHGISLGQTSKLLGITQWELLEYAGQRLIPDVSYNNTLDVKQRAKMALEFFS